jgi:hypothetical protein
MEGYESMGGISTQNLIQINMFRQRLAFIVDNAAPPPTPDGSFFTDDAQTSEYFTDDAQTSPLVTKD